MVVLRENNGRQSCRKDAVQVQGQTAGFVLNGLEITEDSKFLLGAADKVNMALLGVAVLLQSF